MVRGRGRALRTGLWAGLMLSALALSGCELCTDLNCDGGGGSAGDLQFQRGLVFVNAGGNLGAADQSDWATLGTFTSGGGVRHPSVSPDGDTLAFASTDGSTLFSVPSVGGALTTIVSAGGAFAGVSEPVFDPSGERVIFTYASGGVTGIGQVAADGTGTPQALSANAGGISFASPSFDESGRLYVIAGDGVRGGVALGRMDPVTGVYSNLTDNLGNNVLQIAHRAEVSPDGRRIAFDGRTSSGAIHLFVYTLSTGEVVQLNVGGGNQTWPTWVDNVRLAFASDAGGAEQIYLAPVSGGSAELVIPSASQPRFGPR